MQTLIATIVGLGPYFRPPIEWIHVWSHNVDYARMHECMHVCNTFMDSCVNI